jgi:GNAT superfamily N-acetyltransferase
MELDEDYMATLLDGGEVKPVISGGEEDVANLALRLAISQMIADRAGQPLSLLFLDEILGSLDEERRLAVIELLRALRIASLRSFSSPTLNRCGMPASIGLSGSSTMRSAAWHRCTTSRRECWMAWQLDRDLYGPERPTVRDIEPLNRVFSESFTDRYRRDGLLGVRVPHLNPLIWRYALEDAGDGAMVWRDGDGELAGFNVVHFSGSEGWMGPLAVRPDRQGIGLGKEMIRSGIDWLHEKAVQTIGLETMPRTIENIGFYSRLGFLPGHLTITLTRDLPRKPGLAPELASHAAAARVDRVLECRR